MVHFVTAFLLMLALTAMTHAASTRNLKKKPKKPKKKKYAVQLGPRPYFMVDSMKDGKLKNKLTKCAEKTTKFKPSDWSIGHRGACMQFPEHTLESYKAALHQGAGIIECDVTFTKDRELICRHAQCDLHTTTNVVTIPELNAKCTIPFTPGVEPKCCASDFTLEEIKTMCAKMDARVSGAETPEEYIGGVAGWRTTLYSEECPSVPTHKESIELVQGYDAKFTPELKTPQVDMPFEGDYTQEMYAQQMVDEYLELGVDPSDVWPQSFLWSDTVYWVENTDFDQAVALEGNYAAYDMHDDVTAFETYVSDLLDAGVSYIAPPMWMLLKLKGDKMVASDYAKYSSEVGFDIITWTLERSGTLTNGGGWYYQTVSDVVDRSGDQFVLLDALANKVGIVGIFSDWPATTTFYANCMGL